MSGEIPWLRRSPATYTLKGRSPDLDLCGENHTFKIKDMKNKIAVNTKYFSKSKVNSEVGHVLRVFADDKNVLDKTLTANNFGTDDSVMNDRLKSLMDSMVTAKDKSNVLIDSCLVFPLEAFEEVKRKHPKDWKMQISKSILGVMKDMRDQMGFEPIGFKVHLDEGHLDADGNPKLNPHAHLLFANICKEDLTITKTRKLTQKGEDGKALRDPNNPKRYIYQRDEEGNVLTEEYEVNLKNKMPLQHYRDRGEGSVWGLQQDIAAKHLKHLGFERGVVNSKKKHLDKSDHVARKAEQKIKELEAAKATMMEELEDFVSEKSKLIAAVARNLAEATREAVTAVKQSFGNLTHEESKKVAERAVEEDLVLMEGFTVSEEVQEEVAGLASMIKRAREKHEAEPEPEQRRTRRRDDELKL